MHTVMNPYIAKELLASQAELCSMQFVSQPASQSVSYTPSIELRTITAHTYPTNSDPSSVRLISVLAHFRPLALSSGHWSSQLPQLTVATAHSCHSSHLPQLIFATAHICHSSHLPQLTFCHSSQLPQLTVAIAHSCHSSQLPQLTFATAHSCHSSQLS